MEWFKFYGQDWLTDLKIMQLQSVDRLCFITLLCLGNSSEIPGKIKKCREDSVIKLTQLCNDQTDDNNEATRAVGCLQRFNDNGMITIDNAGDVIINNFLKRQGSSLTGYERVKKYREKQKEISEKPQKKSENKAKIRRNVINDNADDNASDNDRLDKNRLDKNREDKKNTGVQGDTAAIAAPSTPKEEAELFFSQMSKLIKGGASDCEWGQEFLRRITEKYGNRKDIVWREINKFVEYWTEPNGTGTKQLWEMKKTFEVRRRLKTWFQKVGMYQTTRPKKTLIR